MTSDAGCLNQNDVTDEWKKKLPMQFTMARIFLTIPCLAAMVPNEFGWNVVAAAVFIVASITDYYDGYFARKFNAVSNMGKFMDPIADKVLVTAVLTLMIVQQKVDPWLVILLTTRDTFIGGIRSVAAADGVIIAAKAAGKWKTGLQMVGIPMVMIWELPFLPEVGGWIGKTGFGLLWISTILSISSGIEYYFAYRMGQKGAA